MKLSFGAKEAVPKETTVVGLDIGSAEIKAVKLEFSKERVELVNFMIEPIAVDLVPVFKKVSEVLNTKKVNLSVSGQGSIIRYASFPKMSRTELAQALKFEAQKHIPFSVAEVNLDSFILKDDLPENKMQILIAAVKKDSVSQRLKSAEDADLKVEIIDIDSLALINAFNFNHPALERNQTVALLNIGAVTTNLNILEGNLPCFSRDIFVGGNNFNQKLMEMFSLEFKAAEDFKLNLEKEKSSKASVAIESVLSMLSMEIRTSFDYYETQSASSVSKIFLSGGSSQLSGLKDRLAEILGTEIEYWDPLEKIDLSQGVDQAQVKIVSPKLPVAIGIALRK